LQSPEEPDSGPPASFNCAKLSVRHPGPHQLVLKVSAGLKDSRGVPTTVRLPDREFKIAVSVHAGKTTARIVARAVIGFGGALAASFLGVVTQELWWPRIKELLQAWGVLG